MKRTSISMLAWGGNPFRAVQAAILLGFLVMGTHSLAGQASAPAKGPVDSVNPFIGTGFNAGGPGNLFPGATTPFGMVQLSPDTEAHGYGYHYTNTDLQGFSMTHMSGPGCANEGDVYFTATTGPVHTRIIDLKGPYRHEDENASPGYYRVRLLGWNIDAALSATDHTGVAQFTFPRGEPANIVVPISRTENFSTGASVQVVSDNQIEGYVEDRAFCGNQQTYRVYFVMQFSKPFAKFGTWKGSHYDSDATLDEGSRSASGTTHEEWIGAYATWPGAAQEQLITAKIGISFVDLDGARHNLEAETAGKDFKQIRSEARAKWTKALSVIDVTGGSATQRTIFYTALYRCLLMPTLFNDADGRYLGFDGKVHQIAAGHNVYANWSGWDIYRDEIPLLALIEPWRMEDMAQSVVLMYQQGGWIDRWPQFNLYTNVMAGSPLTVSLATAWLDGLHGFDMNSAWEGMLKDATQAPPPDQHYRGENGIDWINKIHYAPDDTIKYGSVSQLQEDAVAYASLYRVALDLGKTDDAKMLYQRALYVRNVFDPQDKMFHPRNSDGQWVASFDPLQDSHGFIEGSGWHYQWLEPSDMKWTVNAMGRELFNQRLTEFFNYKYPGWYGQYYNLYNETDLEAPFEFNFSGEPWETQRVVRRVLNENYTTEPEGIPGNDDCGAMSSWAVLSMMGIYSIDPASLAYEMVAPAFPKVVVHLHEPYAGKSFTVLTAGAAKDAAYIESVTLNGKAHRQNWVSFRDISAGATLRFTVGTTPNKSWGAAPDDAPPSLSDQQP